MGNSSSTIVVINQTNNNPPPNAPPQPFVDSLLQWLIKLNDGDAPKPTGDPQKDLDELRNLLLIVGSQKFEESFGYPYNGPETVPKSAADNRFINFTDFTSCPTVEQQKVADYLNENMFGPDSDVPDFALNPMRNDLLDVLKLKLSGSPFDGWTTESYRRQYRNKDNPDRPAIEINAAFVYTIVNAADANGDSTPTLMFYYIGGFFHGESF